MKKAIATGEELIEYFFQIGRNVEKPKKRLLEGVMIGAGIRKEILTSIDQDRITIEGQVLKIKFDNMSGGVYRAYVEK